MYISVSAVEVGFSQPVHSVGEEEGSVQIVITKSGSNARDVGVVFTTVDGTARSKELMYC